MTTTIAITKERQFDGDKYIWVDKVKPVPGNNPAASFNAWVHGTVKGNRNA